MSEKTTGLRNPHRGRGPRGALATGLALLLLPSLAGAALTEVTLRVEGMTWGTWPVIVARALEGLPGVEKATVTFRPPEARVTYDPTRVTVGQMVEAIRQVGFDAVPLEEP